MPPRSLVHTTDLEESVCDSKTQFRAEREQPETAAILVASTMITNDTIQYVVIFADPDIEVAQQYDFVVSQNPSEGGIQRVFNAIFHITR